ncbi:MAG: hypothetical protein QOG64_1846, partial [Acidimicrobiaceae bacterium]|nr:hypothetical protein [Acidimicrobiaceae bacterium]
CGRLAGAPVRSLAEWGWPVLAAVSVAMAVDEMWPGRRLAGLPRQVNEDWLQRYRGWVYGSGFGFQLGTGVLTVVTTAMIYVWLFLALLTRSPVGGLVLGGCFGMVRAAPSLALGGTHRADDLRHFHRRVQRLAEPTRRYSTLALVAVVLALATRR